MSIHGAINEIAEAQGGTPSADGTIIGAIDALTDAMAGSDQERASSIEGAVRLLGEHLNGGEEMDAVIELSADLSVPACTGTLAEGDFAAIREKAANDEPIIVSVHGPASEAKTSVEYGKLYVHFDTYSAEPANHYLYVEACGIDLSKPTPQVYTRPILVYEETVTVGTLVSLANAE